MKKIFNNSRLIAIAFFTVFTTAGIPAAQASAGKIPPVELKYIGNINSQVIFQLVVSGTGNNDFIISIRDPFGNPIYRENIKADNFTKKFLFDTDELGDDILVFEIYNRTNDKTVKYQINRQTRFVDEVLVSAMK